MTAFRTLLCLLVLAHMNIKGFAQSPDKGVTEVSEQLGFKLRPEVETNFELKSEQLGDAKSWKFPKKVIVYSKNEYEVFRKRDGYWKAVEVSIQKSGRTVEIKSGDLKAGDFIATEGIGFLKVVEQTVFGPKLEGHIH